MSILTPETGQLPIYISHVIVSFGMRAIGKGFVLGKETRYLLSVVAKLFPQHRDTVPVSAFSSLRPLVRVSGRSALERQPRSQNIELRRWSPAHRRRKIHHLSADERVGQRSGVP
jgi:hypothetical protein